MQSQDLQEQIASLQLQVHDHENRLDQAFAKNLDLKETKKIYHELRLLKEKLSEISPLHTSNGIDSQHL